MRPNNSLIRRTIPDNYVYKTADDFMRWWKEKNRLKRQAAVEQKSTQAIREMAKALMVWEDDGGSPA